MSTGFLNALVATGFGIAFFHAALPTHWLPFVLAARGQGWSRAKALTVTAAAGFGHILFTIVLGALVLWIGLKTEGLTGNVFPFIAGSVLMAFGSYYLFSQARHGHGHHHGLGFGRYRGAGEHEHAHAGDGHRHGDHDHLPVHVGEGHGHTHGEQPRPRGSDLAVILGLLALLTFSPCEGFLPVYLSGVGYGWSGFALLSVVLALATLAGMVLFTWLTLTGLERVRFSVLERYESGIVGALLILLGVAIMVFDR